MRLLRASAFEVGKTLRAIFRYQRAAFARRYRETPIFKFERDTEISLLAAEFAPFYILV